MTENWWMKDLKIDINKTLLIGIGNSGRSDDGLGWKFVEMISGNGYDFIDYEFRYQLQIEDAALISKYDTVIFVDSSYDKFRNGFELKSCIAASHSFFFSHAQAPGAILCLANRLYDKFPKAFILGITGKDWELGTQLGQEAEKNLQAALSYFEEEFLPTIQGVTYQ